MRGHCAVGGSWELCFKVDKHKTFTVPLINDEVFASKFFVHSFHAIDAWVVLSAADASSELQIGNFPTALTVTVLEIITLNIYGVISFYSS